MQSKSLYIAEKPSVAKEFAKVLNVGGRASDGYVESADRTSGDDELSGSL